MTETILALRDVRKAYRSPEGETVPILDVPSFDLEAGQQVALRGISGSGKTTLLNVIAGILVPDAGSVCLAGTEITALSEARRDDFRARHLGYVFQSFNLLPGLSALDNLLLAMRLGQGADVARARALLARMGLKDRESYRPEQLSVGQRQRVAVARALVNKPQLVLADEPTGNLDAAHAQNALKLIREVCAEEGVALLLVSHDPEILEQFEHGVDLAELNRAVAAEKAS